MRKIQKGNALMTTTIILFAVSIIAAGLTMYFYYASVQNRNTNLYTEKHIELENEFNKKYEILLSGGTVNISGSDSVLYTIVRNNVNVVNQQFVFTDGNYRNIISYVEPTGSEDSVVSYRIETTYRTRDYSLEKTLVFEADKFSVKDTEVYKVNASY